jgi:hypothetical protein
MKPKPGDISIVDNTGTFLMWYDIRNQYGLTIAVPKARAGIERVVFPLFQVS